MTLACKHFELWVSLEHFATLLYQIEYSLQEVLPASGVTGTQAVFLNGLLLISLSIEVNPRYRRRLGISAVNFALGTQESLPRGGIGLQRLELPGWIACVCVCVLGCRCSEGGFRTVHGKSVKERRHLIFFGQSRADQCSPSSLISHQGRQQGQGPKHVHGSYQLTVLQAPVSPHDDSSADVASTRREGGSPSGRGTGVGASLFPSSDTTPAISSLPAGSAQAW